MNVDQMLAFIGENRCLAGNIDVLLGFSAGNGAFRRMKAELFTKRSHFPAKSRFK